MTLAITRNDLSSDEMRLEARRSKDSRVSRRLLALAEVLDGRSRAEAARTGCVQRQTLRDWVCLYNAEGIAGLRDRPRSGRRARLSAAHLAALSALVEAGRMWLFTAWCGGAVSTFANRSSLASMSSFPSAKWAGS